MKYLLISKDPEIKKAFLSADAFPKSDKKVVFEDWREALKKSKGADMIIVDLLATLDEPNRIAGYENFGNAKLDHPDAKDIPLVLINAPAEYDLDFMVGWPDFLYASLQRPVTEKNFRRVSTWL